jgi:arylsulfatase A-like enzyme
LNNDLSRRAFLRQTVGGVAAAPMSLHAESRGAQSAPASRANVLLIMADQFRFDALGAAGNKIIHTPNLDALAGTGVMFRECRVQHPVCMPSRACIFTGRYPSVHRVRTNGVTLSRQEKTLAEVYLESGYRTGGAGKFHFIPQLGRQLPTMETHPDPFYGFEEFHIGEDGGVGEYGQWLKRYHPEFAGKPNNALPLELHNTHWAAAHTIDFIKDCAARREPFFAFCSFVAPHHPYNPPPPYQTMYKEGEMPPPVIRAGELDDKPPFFKADSKRWEDFSERLSYNRAQYYGSVTFIDDAIGSIVRTLGELQIRQDTLVVFTADHGDLLGDHGLWFKGPYHYRACANVPLIFNWPGRVQSGKAVDGIVQNIDLFPSITALTGINNPPGVQGKSQLAVLTSQTSDTGNSSALIEYGVSGVGAPKFARELGHPDLYTLYSPKWRLSYYPGKDYGELYDHESDPEEFVNRWRDPALEAVRRQLKDELLDRVLKAHDPLPVQEVDW